MAFSAPLTSIERLTRTLYAALAGETTRLDFSLRRLLPLGLACALASAGCDGCGREPKVPFKLGSERDAEGELVEGDRPDAEARTFQSAVDHPIVDGKPVPIDFVRALLAHDLDADGDRDVIAVVHDAVLRVRLVASLRDGAQFLAPTDVPGFSAPGDASCTLQAVTLEAPALDKAVLAITLACGDPQQSTPASLTLLSLEAPVRCYERVELVGDASHLPFVLSATASDSDGDGHADFVLQLGAATADGDDPQGAQLSLSLLDRASGLSRDMREPEATFAAWASAAERQLGKHPDEAERNAQRVLRFERALCRERGEPVLAFSGTPGVACGKSKATTSALVTLTLALAKLKQGPAALAAYAELARRDPAPDKRSRERVLSALSTLSSEPGVTLREGPRVEAPEKPRLRLPSARFLDENRLLLSRTSPVLYDLTKGEESPLAALDLLLRDPSGLLALTDIERDACGALHLRIERAPRLETPYLASAPVSTPSLSPLGSLTPCKQSGAQSHAESGYQALGWAPQGVVLARAAEVRVVPLTLTGAAAGEPLLLAAETPLPAPLAAGVATPDGARYAELTPFGVLVFERRGAAPALLRPDGFLALAAGAREIAISPSGQRLVLVANGSAYILTRAAPP